MWKQQWQWNGKFSVLMAVKEFNGHNKIRHPVNKNNNGFWVFLLQFCWHCQLYFDSTPPLFSVFVGICCFTTVSLQEINFHYFPWTERGLRCVLRSKGCSVFAKASCFNETWPVSSSLKYGLDCVFQQENLGFHSGKALGDHQHAVNKHCALLLRDPAED